MAEEKQKAFMKLYEPVHAQFERFCKARVYGQLDFKDLMHDSLIIAFNKSESLKEEKAFLHLFKFEFFYNLRFPQPTFYHLLNCKMVF